MSEPKLKDATQKLALSILAIAGSLTETTLLTPHLLGWAASELERLAGEAYRLADDDDPCKAPIPGFDP